MAEDGSMPVVVRDARRYLPTHSRREGSYACTPSPPGPAARLVQCRATEGGHLGNAAMAMRAGGPSKSMS
jgi:hypothetical protein